MTGQTLSLQPGLYVAATPIGNLKDITYRVVETLKAADLILCEDTRQTRKLCEAYGVKTPLKPYHDHNAAAARPDILERLKDGAAICLVSDAGTPLIADPGYKLVKEAREQEITVIPLPGPSAAITALSAAGAPSDRFLFAGFAPVKDGARARFFAELKSVNATLIFYETGPRLGTSLTAMAAAFGERQGVIARELTKRYEEIKAAPLDQLAAQALEKPPKGEIVVIVHPPQDEAPSPQDLSAFLAAALQEMSVKDAAAAAADAFGTPKKEAYAQALAIKSGKSPDKP